jgi:hypothetical protein
MSAGALAGPLAPYEAILAHAELELELAGRGELEALQALAERWEELIDGLPVGPPRAASSLIERALLIHERTRIELLRLRQTLLGELAIASRAAQAAAGYGGELAVRSRLEHSA